MLMAMFTDEQLHILESFSRQSDKLFSMGITRTDSFTGEIGEFIACRHFALTRTTRSTRAVDATDSLGNRYQIKAKVAENDNFSLNIEDIDQTEIDFLVIVSFESNYTPRGIIRIPSSSLGADITSISGSFLKYNAHNFISASQIHISQTESSEITRFGELYIQLVDSGIVRSRRVVGDIGEFYACRQLGLKLASNLNEEGVDAIDQHGTTYEIKTRRVYESDRRTSRTRRLNNLVSKSSDVLVVVVLDKSFRCDGMWTMPLKNVFNPKSAHLGIVKTTPGVKVVIPTHISWLQ